MTVEYGRRTKGNTDLLCCSWPCLPFYNPSSHGGGTLLHRSQDRDPYALQRWASEGQCWTVASPPRSALYRGNAEARQVCHLGHEVDPCNERREWPGLWFRIPSLIVPCCHCMDFDQCFELVGRPRGITVAAGGEICPRRDGRNVSPRWLCPRRSVACRKLTCPVLLDGMAG